jgi:hypothetical protein
MGLLCPAQVDDLQLSNLQHSQSTTTNQIAKAAKAQNWTGRFNIHVGGYNEIEGEYG